MVKNIVMFTGPGVLTRASQPNEASRISSVSQNADGSTIYVYNDDTTTSTFETSNVSLDRKTGRLEFVAEDTEFRARDYDESDALWMSKYHIVLPFEALDTRIDEDNMIPNESLEAYVSDESVYVVGVGYYNDLGQWARISGGWVSIDPSDDTYSDMGIIEIDPTKAKEFISFFDRNHVTTTDAERYELPSVDISIPAPVSE